MSSLKEYHDFVAKSTVAKDMLHVYLSVYISINIIWYCEFLGVML